MMFAPVLAETDPDAVQDHYKNNIVMYYFDYYSNCFPQECLSDNGNIDISGWIQSMSIQELKDMLQIIQDT